MVKSIFEMSYVDVFKKIKTNFQIEQIVSYQEIGLIPGNVTKA